MENRRAEISVNNGLSFCTPEEAIEAVGIDEIVKMMDDETRNLVQNIFTVGSDVDFINLYLDLADEDLIIG